MAKKKKQAKSKSVFASHKYEDKQHKNRLKQWEEKGLLGTEPVITGETKDVRHKGKKAVKKHLNQRMKGASDVVVLTGNDTHNSKGVNYEVQNAKSQGKRIHNVRIPGTTGAPPKPLRKQKEIPMHPDAIKKELNTQSKNSKKRPNRRKSNASQKKK